MRDPSDFAALETAVINHNALIQPEIAILRQFVTELFQIRNRSENADAFMEKIRQSPIIHELRIMATGLKLPVRCRGDLDVKQLFAKLEET